MGQGYEINFTWVNLSGSKPINRKFLKPKFLPSIIGWFPPNIDGAVLFWSKYLSLYFYSAFFDGTATQFSRKMKIFSIITFCVSFGHSEIFRKFENADVCLADDDISGEIENGHVVCEGEYCRLKCDSHYHFYGGPPKTRCKSAENKGWTRYFWTRKLGSCKTCNEIAITDSTIQVFTKKSDIFFSAKQF